MGDAKLTHLDEQGRARMVDVSDKEPTTRVAVAECFVELAPQTYALIMGEGLPKGDALGTARIAGIQGGKRTSDLIPLCHPLPLSFVDVRFEPDPATSRIRVEGEARTTSRTGVEMEALTAASVAALTIYDMCKAVQKDIVVTGLRLLSKTGGKSGPYRAK